MSAAAAVSAPAVRVDDLTLGYERHPAVHHLQGAFAAGRVSAVVGPNGSGKSTLLKGLAGQLTPLSGRIDRAGLKPAEIAYLPQDPGIDRAFPMSLHDLVSLGLWRKRGLFSRHTAADEDRIAAAFQAVGLEGLERRALNSVSGGQLQRALFARVLVQDAALVLLDEPFTALDARTTADLIEVVRRFPGEGRTVVMVLHDLDMVRSLAAETLLLSREPVAWGPTEAALAPEHLLRARRLSEAWAERPSVCRHEAEHEHEHAHDHGHAHGHTHGPAAGR